jgi:hypothetical protein
MRSGRFLHYAPRPKAKGKKIGFGDWATAVGTFAKYRKGWPWRRHSKMRNSSKDG